MAKKKEKFRFTLKHFFRLLIFFLIMYLAVSYLSSAISTPTLNDPTTVLGEEIGINPPPLKNLYDSLYDSLPPDSRQKLENLNEQPLVRSINDKWQYINNEAKDFPQKQIKEIKKSIIQSIYQDLMSSLNSS